MNRTALQKGNDLNSTLHWLREKRRTLTGRIKIAFTEEARSAFPQFTTCPDIRKDFDNIEAELMVEVEKLNTKLDKLIEKTEKQLKDL